MTRVVVSGSSAAGSEVTAQFCQVAHNLLGMQATSSGKVRLSDSSLTGNGTGIDPGPSGSFETFTTNQIRGNGVDVLGGFPALTAVALQ